MCYENYKPTNYKLQSFMKKVTDGGTYYDTPDYIYDTIYNTIPAGNVAHSRQCCQINERIDKYNGIKY